MTLKLPQHLAARKSCKKSLRIHEVQLKIELDFVFAPILISKQTQVVTSHLVGGFNPFENISQNGNLPQIGVKIKNI